MKRTLRLFSLMLSALLVGATAIAQLPAAIQISPSNATADDEITLTVTPAQGCTPAGKTAITGSTAQVAMHSAAFTYDNIANWGAAWGGWGVDWNATPKDGIHTNTLLTNNGDGTFSITFTPRDYYGVDPGATIIGLTMVFNGNDNWASQLSDVKQGTTDCQDFYIPLHYANPVPALKFVLDMSYWGSLGKFDTTSVDHTVQVVINDTIVQTMEQLLDGIIPTPKYAFTWIDANLDDTTIMAGHTYRYHYYVDTAAETIADRTVEAISSQKILNDTWNGQKPAPKNTFTVKVDMTYQIKMGNFDPGSDFVSVAGTFNGWSGSDNLTASPDNDSIWIGTVTAGLDSGMLQFKFKKNNSDWENDVQNRRFPFSSGSQASTTYVFDNQQEGAPVKFSVNMSYFKSEGEFDPANDFVDLAGVTNWDQWNGWILSPDGNNDVYSITINLSLKSGDTWKAYNGKYRINGNWVQNELPGSAPNRVFQMVDTAGGVMNQFSAWYNDEMPNVAAAPVASDLQITGSGMVGVELDGTYTYSDPNGDGEGTSLYSWYLSATPDGKDSTVVSTNLEYTPVLDDIGKYVFFMVTPVADSSSGTGDPVMVGAAVSVSFGTVTKVSTSTVNAFKLYPNPVSTVLSVSSSKDIKQVVISNIVGQQVLNVYNTTGNTMNISTANLQQGIYLISVYGSNGLQGTSRFTKR